MTQYEKDTIKHAVYTYKFLIPIKQRLSRGFTLGTLLNHIVGTYDISNNRTRETLEVLNKYRKVHIIKGR